VYQDDFIIVRRALEKEQIDEIIKISESTKESKLFRISGLEYALISSQRK
jgi:hypothetical protein